VKFSRKWLIAIAVAVVLVAGGVTGWLVLRPGANADSKAASVVSGFFDVYKEKDSAAGQYLASGALSATGISFDGIQGVLAERLTYKVTGSETDKNTDGQVLVDVKVTTVDVAKVLQSFEQTTETDPDKLLAEVMDAIEASDVPLATRDCQVVVASYPAGMRIVMTADLSNVLLGGFNEYLASQLP